MKIAITGVSGYLGRKLATALTADPSVEYVVGLDLADPRLKLPRFTFVRADVRSADFGALFDGCDVVFHLAFIVEPPRSMTMARIDEINISGSRRVFEGAAAAGVHTLVHASSVAAYGVHRDNPELLTEECPLRPNEGWYYSRAKGVVEAILDRFERQNPSMTVIRLRPSIFLGPGVANTLGRGFAGKVLLSFNSHVAMDLCWDEDVVRAFVLAMRHPRSAAFNITGGNPVTVDAMAQISGKRVLHVKRRYILPFLGLACRLGLFPEGGVEWLRVALDGPMSMSAEKARRELGWVPRFDSAETYLEYLKSLKGKR